MKNHSTIRTISFAAAAVAAALAGIPFAHAQQQPTADATQTQQHEFHGGHRGHRGGHHRFASLTPEERAKLKAAHQAAMQDPAVQAAKTQRDTARRAYRDTMRAAMLKADPSLGPTLDKAQADRGQWRERMQRRLSVLNPDERAKLKAAHQGVRNDPAVTAAHQQMESATTPEARQQARRLMAEAVRNAMLRNDPSLGPILDKLRQADASSSL